MCVCVCVCVCVCISGVHLPVHQWQAWGSDVTALLRSGCVSWIPQHVEHQQHLPAFQIQTHHNQREWGPGGCINRWTYLFSHWSGHRPNRLFCIVACAACLCTTLSALVWQTQWKVSWILLDCVIQPWLLFWWRTWRSSGCLVISSQHLCIQSCCFAFDILLICENDFEVKKNCYFREFSYH